MKERFVRIKDIFIKTKDRTKRTAQVYDSIAESYAAKKANQYSEKEIGTFTELLFPGSRILSIGCGHGRDEARFKHEGFAPVGVDVSKKLLKIARQQNPDIPFYLGDMRSLRFPDESFEGVWAHESLHHIERGDIPKALSEFHRVLKPEGILFVLTRYGKGDVIVKEDMSSGKAREYTLTESVELDTMLTQSGFEQIQIDTFNENERGGRDLEWLCAFYRKAKIS